MDSLTQKIVKVEKELRELYVLERKTKPKYFANVLPTYSALKNLKKITEDILQLWNFYKARAFSRHLHKHPELLRPKSKMSVPKKRSSESLLAELRAYDDKPRGYI